MLVDGISSISNKKHKRWRGRVVNVCCNTGLKPALSNAPSPPPPTRAVSVACRHCSIPISAGSARQTLMSTPQDRVAFGASHGGRFTLGRQPVHCLRTTPENLRASRPPCGGRGPLPQVPAAFRVQRRVRPRRVRVYEQCGRFRRPIALCVEPAQRPRPPGQPSDVGQAAQAIKGLSDTRRGHRSAPPAPHPPQ